MTSKENKPRRAGSLATEQHDGLNESGNDALLCNADRLTHDSTQTDELRNQWASVVAEYDRNLTAFNAYVADVREQVERNHGWVGGTDHLRAFIRNGRFVTDEGTTFKVTHGHDAVWCREVCRRNPDVAPHILPTLRPSKYDVFYPDLFGGAAHE